MSVSRKCPDCGTWNGAESHCGQCGCTLDPELIRAEKEAERIADQQRVGPSGLDQFFERFKHSKWLVIRGLYKVLYSIWFVFFSIVSFFLALIAGTPL